MKSIILYLLLSALPAAAHAGIVAGPVVNPANGHVYYLLSRSTWTDAQAEAVRMGGNLATIRNAQEQEWIYSTFKDHGVLWIGLTDQEQEGVFKWISGEPLDYTHWPEDQPDNGTGGVEHFVHIWPADHTRAGTWNDYVHTDNLWGAPLCGVVEIAGKLSAIPPENSFLYPAFIDATGLILRGFAKPVEGRLRVAPGIGGKTLGSAWRRQKQPVADGFETVFQIQISGKHSSGADGMAFVIMNSPVPGLGHSGDLVGFGGLTNLLVVKFDNYHWDRNSPGNFDEVSVRTARSPVTPLWTSNEVVLAAANDGVVFSDGAVRTARISYVPGLLRVFLNDIARPLLEVKVDLAGTLNLDEGCAWVGFTAAGGADWQNHDVVSWWFVSREKNPPSGFRPIADTEGSESELSSPAMAFRATAPATGTEVGELARDPAFGHSLPAGVELRYPIEVSTDLIHWTPLTNATLYFKDPESTYYNTRFYRFREQ